MIDKMKPHLLESAIFETIILLLSAGTLSRNNIWKDEIGLGVDCVKKSPKTARPYIQLGVAYFNAGAYDRSLETVQRAIQLDPKHGEAYYILGLAYKQTGDARKAIEAVIESEREIKISPSYSLAHLNLGQIYWYEIQNRQKAIDHLKTALMLDPLLPNRGEIRKLVRLLEGLP